ncbi:S66 peptidase family protein [Flavobacterium columnare]|uniref:LD-carboxypeptidase n=1 Tax=Flavobacterium columnare TaxID=996 RepID=A0AAI8GC97_9FLAO|nr:LD-carboxypeptidase [Flavobacterium columnare]AMO21472.2 LD-carboxypeptidase [Flavobacterium columnare]AUX18363.1 LD-carboxypeptidase [Flavobacterium columnare]MEB3801321.1 LD-carboxypeptidase [Flavobacterium columnare]QOG57445.1 LD-carboxypeptidase [Flavobacterium columnare]QOG60169.1 LD-carboxypeptidase [Flavobacterium columnare]
MKFYLLFSLIFSYSYSQKKMITPPYLKKGDTVAIVATARKNLDDNLKPAIDLLKSWGLEVKIGGTIGLDLNQLAGTDEQRAKDFQEQLDNPNIKMIWCVRGGYGTVRMIDLLDFTKFKQNPKWIVGFSDVTVLHSHLNTMGYKTIHGIMPVTVAKATKEAKESMRIALFNDEQLEYTILPHFMNRLGTAKGELVGGNLSILYSLFGSSSAIDCTDKILFIEDLDEYLYHIDRMMMNLKRNGCLESIKGILVGGMTKMKDNEIPWGKDALQIVDDVTKKYNIPIVFEFPAGHIRDNRALTLGAQIVLDVNTECSKVVFER